MPRLRWAAQTDARSRRDPAGELCTICMSVGPTPDAPWSGDPGLPPETRALLACARAVIDRGRLTEFRIALAECSDVELLCEAAVSQGMLGHLHQMVSAAKDVDPALVNRLARLQGISSRRCLRQTGYLVRLLDELETSGVRAIPYKGPMWAERLYGDVTLRSWVDLDLLVAHEHMPRARELFLHSGFVDGNAFNAELMSRRRRGWGEVHFVSTDGHMHLDVHWEVTVGFSGRSLTAETLLARSRPSSLLAREVIGLSAVDMLLTSALHGTRHRWHDIEGILGMAVLVDATPRESWAALMAEARKAGCRRRVAVSVAHVCRVLGLELPGEVAGAIERDATARALLRSLRPDSLSRSAASSGRGELVHLLWVFATEDSIAAGLWHGFTRLFRPGPADWATLGLPRYMEWLYYMIRPFRLAGKWVRRLLH